MVTLTVFERLTLLGVLPEKGNLAVLRIVEELRGSLSFTEQEIVDFDVEIEDNRVKWNEEKANAAPREYDFGATATKTIVDALQKLDKDGLVELKHLSLMDKFGID